MFTRPGDLTDERIVAELAVGWEFQAETCSALQNADGLHAALASTSEPWDGGHEDTEDAVRSWENLVYFLQPAERWPGFDFRHAWR